MIPIKYPDITVEDILNEEEEKERMPKINRGGRRDTAKVNSKEVAQT